MSSGVDSSGSFIGPTENPGGSLFIEGSFAAAQGAVIAGKNPADGSEGFSYQAATAEEVGRAVASSRRALKGIWLETSPGLRKRQLCDFASAIADNADALAAYDSLDTGKPISMALGEVPIAAGFIRYYAEAIDKINMGEVPATGVGITEIQHFRARGVVAAVVPWNFPLINACLKLGPALAAGNTCILKPAEISPRSALLLAKIACESGLPEGVLNVVAGDAITGSALVGDSGVDMVTFTGSTATGKNLLAQLGATTIKPLLLECGGKSPEIIFEDAADIGISTIAAGLVAGAFWNQGQVCVARSRILVQESLYVQVCEAIVAEAQKMSPGHPQDKNTTYGPMACESQYEKVLGYIERGLEEGAELLLDGRSPEGFDGGYFIGPTIFGAADQGGCLVRDEIFGPIIVLMPFKDEEEALALANSTDYGLAATIWTRDPARSQRMARRIKAGKVRLVSTAAGAEPAGFNHSAEPYGQSGFGVEGGLEGMRSYLRRQSVEHVYG